ncbi:hypothetical protein BDN72DRAFT_376379 [Pluteus cervinus]|uniref:Uncharacterized protein n=1 Tax=Pluteus cervinus TaxID=181527 RepID=A0ACD3AA29_9AGAR|nr:hypothetical protein BDN72DRAFT_376379 [Pluteus cervinus]
MPNPTTTPKAPPPPPPSQIPTFTSGIISTTAAVKSSRANQPKNHHGCKIPCEDVISAHSVIKYFPSCSTAYFEGTCSSHGEAREGYVYFHSLSIIPDQGYPLGSILNTRFARM